MSNENRELTALETALTGLVPAPARMDRDGLLYSAGRAAGSRRWKQAACGFAGLCLALTVFLFARPPRTVDRPIVVTVPIVVPISIESPPVSPPSAAESVVHSEPADSLLGSPSVEMRWRWRPDGLPSVFGAPTTVTAPPTRPLEKDLDLPPGSLNGVEPRRSLSTPAPW